MSDQRIKTLLLVEDNAGDVRLTQEAFRDAHQRIDLQVASGGKEAIAFLKRDGTYVDTPRPDLILLDLNLPKLGGHEVLAYIKNDDGLKMIPTVVLSCSDAEADIVKSYQLQANCYLTKPGLLDAFEILVKSMGDFWLTRAELPRRRQIA
jgi:chemotaxis family two-component system response regulator Rcp1